MRCVRGTVNRLLARGMLMLAACAAGTSPAPAQAWVPPAGVGSVNVIYQTIDNTGHRLTDGSVLEGYDSVSRGLLLEADYALTDRLSISAGLPYVGARYLGPEPSFSG